MIYVALLRGVNVGGNHRVPKTDLQAVLEGLNFSNVRIFLNSGNAIFSSDSKVDSAVVQSALELFFGFNIPTLILTSAKIQKIVSKIPPDWTNDPPHPDKSGQKSDVLFLFDEINSPAVLDDIGYNPAIESMIYIDGAVIANVTRRNQSKGSLQKMIGTKIYANVTVRNVNTARKLAELVEA